MWASLILLILGIASLQVWVVALRRWHAGRPVLSPGARVASPWMPVAFPAAIAYVALLLILQASSVAESPDVTPELTIEDVQHACLDGLMVIAIALALLTGLGQASLDQCGIHLRHFGRQLADGGWAFLASMGPVLLLLLATGWLRTEDNQHPFLKLLREDISLITFGWVVLSAVVIAPIKEELLFRVILQDGLARRIGAAPAITVVAVLFCAVHGFPDSIALFPLAVILGYVYQQRQSALTVIVTHALFNLTFLMILRLAGPD